MSQLYYYEAPQSRGQVGSPTSCEGLRLLPAFNRLRVLIEKELPKSLRPTLQYYTGVLPI